MLGVGFVLGVGGTRQKGAEKRLKKSLVNVFEVLTL